MGTLFVDKLDPQSGTSLELGSSGDTITIPSGCTITNNGTQTGFGGNNTPAFEAKRSSAVQAISNSTSTKIQFNTEIYDSAGAYDHSTNYRFTPQTAGKYFVYARVMCRAETNGNLIQAEVSLRKNGSNIGTSRQDLHNSYGNNLTPVINQVVDMNGSSDYVEAWGLTKVNSGNAQFYNDGNERTIFGAFLLIGA